MQPERRRIPHRYRLEPIRRIKIIFARLVDNPHHPMPGILIDKFIKPTKRYIVPGYIAQALLMQTNHEFQSHFFTFIFTLPIPCASYQ